jgi:4-hydroxyproline epimerase
MTFRRIQVVDSHTGGEPTRVILAGGPDLGQGDMASRRRVLAEQHGWFRSAVVNEPRGSEVLVGALLCSPTFHVGQAAPKRFPSPAESKHPAVDPAPTEFGPTGVIFFNNVGCLGMCGHGMIGVAVTLGHLGRITAGRHTVETPVGRVDFVYDGASTVTIDNVPSYRYAAGIGVEVPGHGRITGDVAWGGNWFFLTSDHGQSLDIGRTRDLTSFTQCIREALAQHGITGAEGAEIDHIELFGPPHDPASDSRNFVLCPGGAYDRSPCGTGTSAKLACLAADGKLAEGQIWRQESILGSVFEASYRLRIGKLIPSIKGTAYITAEATLLLDDRDPLGRARVPPNHAARREPRPPVDLTTP